MPAQCGIVEVAVDKPLSDVFLAEIIGNWCYKMIKNNVMNLGEIKARNVAHVARIEEIWEKMGTAATVAIGFIDEFGENENWDG